MIVQFVQFETSLGEDKALAVAREREPAYAATPGLLQKYYLRLGKPNHFGGLMIWETPQALQAFRESDLARSVPSAYGVIGAPDVDIYEMLFPLRRSVVYRERSEVA